MAKPPPPRPNRKKLTPEEKWAFWRHRLVWTGRVVGAVVAVVGSAVGSAWLYHYIKTAPWLALHHVDVSGAERAEDWEIRALADAPMGTHLFDLPISDIAHRVGKHPWVEEVSVRRSFPDRLVIEVEERKPMALLAAASFYYVDEQGQPFKKVKAGESIDFPILTGFERPEDPMRKDGRLGSLVIREALSLLDRMEKAGLPRAQVAEVHIHPERGFSFYLVEGGAEVILGFSHFEERIGRLLLLRQTQGLELARVARVDLDLDKGAVVTLLPSKKSRVASAQ